MDLRIVIVLIIVGFLIGLSKGGLGAVLGVLAAPLLVLIMPPAAAISLSLPLLMFGDVFALHSYWNTWDMGYIRLLLPTAILGIVVGTYLLATLDSITLRHIIGAFTLLFVGYRVVDNRLRTLRYQSRTWHGYLTGVVSGIGSALANAGAVPFTAYMLLQDVSPRVFVGTTTLYFALLNLLKVPGYILTGLFDLETLIRSFWALPFIPVGVYVARWIVNRIDKATFERIILAVLTIASAVLLLSS